MQKITRMGLLWRHASPCSSASGRGASIPYYQLARVAGSSLMAGNTLAVKHASGVPQCALAFEALLREAGAPEGEVAAAINTVGSDEVIDASLALVMDRRGIATIVNRARAQRDGLQALGGESGNDQATTIRDNARYAVASLAQCGALDVHVDRCFPLREASGAHELTRKGGAGRLVLIA